jgi:glycosyltransferase involved in cell wall biosynthesis
MPTPRQPRLLVTVANVITGDSRVQKIAIAAARDGWDVTLLGRAHGPEVEESTMGPIKVIRVPINPHLERRVLARRPKRRMWRAFTQFRVADADALAGLRAEHQAWVRRTSARIGWMRHGPHRRSLATRLFGLPLSYGVGLQVRARMAAHRLRVRAYEWEERRASAPVGDWRRDWPLLMDLDLAFGPMIEKLNPDMVHANDITMIGPTAQAVARMRARGETVSWLYDAHEYVNGNQWETPRQGSAYRDMEREFIRRADAVVTVSTELAAILQREHRLPEAPLVVRNMPVQAVVSTRGPSVRRACGLPPGVPLLVYAGWVARPRGLHTMVRALPRLPGVHFAIVAASVNGEIRSLLKNARALKVQDRVHVVPYVAQHAVPAYLSSADLGVIPLRRMPNHEISLPTKLGENLHAGLPVVVSDVKILSEFVRQHGVGEVFAADNFHALADAVSTALARREELTARITPELLRELSWEHQTDGLLALYRTLSGLAPTTARPDVPWTVQEPAEHVDGVEVMAGAGEPPDFDSAPIRLGFGPANYAGQASAFAEAIRRSNPKVATEVIMRRPLDRLYPADVYVDKPRLHDLGTQLQLLQRVLGRYTHLVADAFLPIFGHLNGYNIEDDLPALRNAGVKVALLGHGSDLRHPGNHLARHEISYFHDTPEAMMKTLTETAERNHRLAAKSGLPVFVTTPDLLLDVPHATWAPVVVDLDVWACDRPVMVRPRPVVLHGPSKRWTKSTDHILPVLQDLHDRGAIEFRLAENIQPEEMAALVRDADIVLDQFGSGCYGAFAVEAMAAGKPVLAYLGPGLDQLVGERPPIVNATPRTLREALEALLDDRDRAAEIGRESLAYVHRYHDGRRTAEAFEAFVNS